MIATPGKTVEILLIVLTVGLPILKFVLFPARAMGRGGNWTIIGALMIVGVMMAVWFGVQSVTDTGMLGTASAVAAKPGDPPPAQSLDLDSLSQLF